MKELFIVLLDEIGLGEMFDDIFDSRFFESDCERYFSAVDRSERIPFFMAVK